jgi:hypothetical protein
VNLQLILGVLKEALKLWNAKEKNKYLNEVLKLEKEYYEELSKDELNRSQLYLDERLRDIRRIAENFVKYASKE